MLRARKVRESTARRIPAPSRATIAPDSLASVDVGERGGVRLRLPLHPYFICKVRDP